MILTTASCCKTFYCILHAAAYREKHISFPVNSVEPGCSSSGVCTTMEGSVSSGAADQRLERVAPSYLVVLKHSTLKNNDLILQLLWNFLSLTSFNYCNCTSQSKKPWNFFYMCLQEQGFIIMQNLHIFCNISPPIFSHRWGLHFFGFCFYILPEKRLECWDTGGCCGGTTLSSWDWHMDLTGVVGSWL